MKLLFFRRSFEDWQCSWASFFNFLCNHPSVETWGPGLPNFKYDTLNPEKVDVIASIKRIYGNDYPDVVMQTSTKVGSRLFNRLRGSFETAKCIKAMWLSDFHNDVGREHVFNYIKNNIDVIFKSYDVDNETEWSRALLDAGVSLEWSPFSIDPKVFYDRKLPKILDVLNIGVKNTQNYPFRYRVQQLMMEQENIKYEGLNVMHKELENEGWYDSKPIRGENYVSLINQSRMFTTDCSTYRFAVQKMFEVMACNTLLLCNTPLSAEKLGFKSKVNYVDWEHDPIQASDVDDKKVMELINYYLENPDESSKIARRGYDLVHLKHTHEVRMKEFFATLEKYI